jgi:thiamine-monophosphate kinase
MEIGQWLAEHAEVHAMMDLSDGLQKDLPRLAEASACELQIDLEKLPLSTAAKEAATDFNIDPLNAAVSGGEDYALLFTVERKACKKLAKEFAEKFRRPLYAIGAVTAGKGAVFQQNGRPVELTSRPFEHF